MKKKMMRNLLYLTLVLGLVITGAPMTAEAAVTTYTVTANGSDTNSDFTAIENALANAKNTSSEIKVIIPKGTYYIDNTLTIYSNTTLELQDGAVIKRASGFEDIMLDNAHDDDTDNHGGYERTKNITVTGGTWDGTISNPQKAGCNILYIGHAQNVTISNTTIKNCYGVHLLELTGVKNATVSNVTFDGFKATGNTTEDEVKEALQIDTVTEVASEHYAPYDNTTCADITVTGCSFNNYPVAIGTHDTNGTTTGVVVKNNTFKNISNIILQINNYKDAEISNNTMQSGTVTPKNFIVFQSSNGVISGNTIEKTTKDAIYLNTATAEVKNNKINDCQDHPVYITNSNVTVSGNTIDKTPNNGVHLSSGTATVNGNTIKNCEGSAIYAGANTTLKADANTLSDCGKDVICTINASVVECTNNKITNKATYGIYVAGGNANTKLSGNTISVTAANAILLHGGSDSVIENNNVSGYSEYGIYVKESSADVYSSKVTIKGNTATGGEFGIGVRKAKDTTISGNTITSTSVGSIYVADTCSGSVVKDNTFDKDLGVYDTSATISNNKNTSIVEDDTTTDDTVTDAPVVNNTGKWLSDSTGWWYQRADGSYPANCWEQIDGVWYAFNTSGYMREGWFCDGATWYYLNPGSGAMATGWINDGGTWYYMNSSGAMQTGWVNDGGTWYYMNGSGAMAIGWVNDGGTWYYMNGSGAMETGWVNDGGTWYYMNGSGAMATGWIEDGGTWYYLYSSGAMASNTWIGSYYLNSSGAWVS